MRVYHRQTQRGATVGAGAPAWTYPVPTATVRVRLPAGATVENLTATYGAPRQRLYFDTTNSLYTSAALYQADWTITIAGTAYTTTDFYVHYTPGGGETTPPGPPSITILSFTDTTVTLAHTPPTDADYDHTTIYAVLVPGDGTAPVTINGTGASITVTGLLPGRSYYFVGIAYDTSGNPSTPGLGSVAHGATHTTTMPALPLLVKVFVNQEPLPRKVYYLDPTLVDANLAEMTNFELRPNVRGRSFRVRLECDAPVRPSCRGIGGLFAVREGEVGGLKGRHGN